MSSMITHAVNAKHQRSGLWHAGMGDCEPRSTRNNAAAGDAFSSRRREREEIRELGMPFGRRRGRAGPRKASKSFVVPIFPRSRGGARNVRARNRRKPYNDGLYSGSRLFVVPEPKIECSGTRNRHRRRGPCRRRQLAAQPRTSWVAEDVVNADPSPDDVSFSSSPLRTIGKSRATVSVPGKLVDLPGNVG